MMDEDMRKGNKKPFDLADQVGGPGRSEPVTAGRNWTPNERQQLRESLDKGMTKKEIAEDMGKTVPSVRAAIDRAGLQANDKRPTWTPEDTLRLKDQWGKMSTKELAKELGVSRNAVIGKADRMGLSRPEAAPKGPRGTPGLPKLKFMRDNPFENQE